MVYRKHCLQGRAWAISFRHWHKSLNLQLLAKTEAFLSQRFVKWSISICNNIYNFFDVVINEEITRGHQVTEPITRQHIKNGLLTIRKTLTNQYSQNWLEIQNCSTSTSREKFTHKEVKKSYEFENYLKTVTNPAQRISLTVGIYPFYNLQFLIKRAALLS